MKKNTITLIVFLLCVGATLFPLRMDAEPLSVSAEASSKDRPKVRFSFDAYANHPKVKRVFVSQEMLAAALASGTLKNGTWDITHIVQRLTSLLSLHTHSKSTSQQMRATMQELSRKKQYELLIHTYAKTAEILAFCHRSGKNKIDEIVVFRFRDGYCGRIIQITGDLRSEDVMLLMKLKSRPSAESDSEGNAEFPNGDLLQRFPDDITLNSLSELSGY